MALDIRNITKEYGGKTRVAIDEGTAKAINHSITEASLQFTAAVENLIRTPAGESTHNTCHSFVGACSGIKNEDANKSLQNTLKEMFDIASRNFASLAQGQSEGKPR